VSVISFCTYKCYRLLANSRSYMSPQTRRLYYTLINALVIDVGSVVCVAIVPYTISFVLGNTNYPSPNSLTALCQQVGAGSGPYL